MVDYELLSRQVQELASEDPWFLPLMANVSALLYETLPDAHLKIFDGASHMSYIVHSTKIARYLLSVL